MNRSFAFLFCTCFLLGSYGQTFYNAGNLQKIEVYFAAANWDYMLDTAKAGADNPVMAQWVKINGSYFDSVGVKYKGNSSYNASYLKNPMHIDLGAYKNQDYQGFKDVKLSNGYADPSMVREVLAYDILGNYMDCPGSNFAQVYINGTYMGVYSNSESVNKTFLANHFYSNSGTFVKGNPNLTPSPNVKSNLKYIAGGDSSSYTNYYELKSNYGWKNLEALCDSITNKPNNISTIIDVDRVTWMMAFNTLLINLDSYNGAFAQNYYLYKDNTLRFNPIIWDLNMSFGGFPFLGNANTSLLSLSIPNMQNLPLNSHATDAYWPLIKAIFSNPMYKRMYVAHIKTMTNDFFANNLYVTKYNACKAVIDTAVLSDSKKFYSYTQFQNALTDNVSVGSYSVPGIQTLMTARVAYLQATADFAYASPTITAVNSFTGTSGTGNTATITAQVNNATSAYLGYRSAESSRFSRVPMYDDGVHGDGAANDNVFAVNFTLIPNDLQYYIYAENNNAGMFSPERAEHEFHTINILPHPAHGEVVINEFLAYNKSDVKNEFHTSEDWIELYNTTSKTLSLKGYYLTDDHFNHSKYALPAGAVIQPHGFFTVWADGVTSPTSQTHSNFKLDENGERIMLSNGRNDILDEITFGVQEADVSFGRCADGTGPFKLMTLPSYGMYNCVVGMEENNLSAGYFEVFPNPASSYFTVANKNAAVQKLQVLTITGQLVYEDTVESSVNVNTSSWPAGVYLVKCGTAAKKLIINN